MRMTGSTLLHENDRLTALRRYMILDTEPDPMFDRIVDIASKQFNVPIALISLIDKDRQWFKASCGLEEKETAREISFCTHTIMGDDVLVVLDATKDERFSNNPLVQDGLQIRFYAGAPLINSEGYALGTLCLVSDQVREEFDEADQILLQDLASVIVNQIEMRYAANHALEKAETQLQIKNDLAIAKHQLALFFEYVPIAVAMFDHEMRFQAGSRCWREIFKTGNQSLAGRKLSDIRPDLPAHWHEQYEQCLAGEIIKIEEDKLPLVDGEFHWVRRQLQPWRNRDGNIGGLISSVEIINERKKAINALEESQRFNEAVLDNIQDRIVACDAEGNLSLFNEATHELHNSDSEPVPPEQWSENYDLYDAEGEQPLETEEIPLFRALKGEVVEKQEIVIVPDEGKPRNVVAKASPMFDSEGRKIGAVASMHDVTKVREARAKIDELDARYRAIFDHTFQFCSFLEPDGTLIDVNETTLKFSGYSREDLVYRPFWEAPWWRGNDARVAKLKDAIQRVAAGEFMRYAVEVDGADNVKLPIDFSLKPIEDEDGKVIHMIAEGRDISELVAAEHALRRNQAELALILDSIPMRIFYKDDKNRILRLNQPAADSLGMKIEDIEGRKTYDLFPEQAEKYYKDDLEVIKSGESKLGIIEKYTTKHGEHGWVRTDKVPYVDPETEERFIFSAAMDITAEKHAEEALRISEKRYRTLYNSTPVMLHSIGPDGRLLSVSDLWLEKLGYKRGEVIGRPSSDFLTPDSKRKADRANATFLSKGSCKDIEYQFLTKNGKVIDVLLSAVAEFDDNKNVIRSMAVLTDITEGKKVERQLLQAQKMESVGQLTGGLAHDFNNLLGVVLGNLQLIDRTVQHDEKAHKRVQSAQAAVEKGAELTRRLLAFSRRQPLETESLEPNPLIESFGELLERTLGEQIALECHLADNMPRIRTDPSQLESAILNLAVNARDSMPDGGLLTIESQLAEVDENYARRNDLKPGEYVLLAVTDTGNGIPKDIINQVFEPFFTTKETGKGSGLGLSMIYGFMKQTGGHVNIYSEAGCGTTVRLYFPIDRDNVDNDMRIDAGQAVSTINGNNETLLVVEDQAEVREVAAALLEDLGYQVVTAPDGPSGLKILKQRQDIDLLFTDMVMPGGMNGPSLAIEARKLRPNFPVVFTTGYADAAVLRESQIAETGNLITKPYQRDHLGEKIRRALDEARA